MAVLHGTGRTFANRVLLCDRHGRVQINLLDRVQQLDALGHRSLERLAPADQTLTARAFVDHRCADGGREVALAL